MKKKNEKQGLVSIASKDKLIPILLTAIVVLLVGALIFKKVAIIFLALILGIVCILLRLFSGRLRADAGEVCILWGYQGSGKTMLAVKTARELKKDGWLIAGNKEFASIFDCDYNFEKHHMGHFRPLPHTAYFIDEASLNGYDNRDFAKNFNRPGVLDFWKKCRHNEIAIFLTNQGWNEIDCKIREALTKTIYYIENRGWYSVATRMDKVGDFDPDTGQPTDAFVFPSLMDRLRDPSCQVYYRHKKYGQFYKSVNPDPLPLISDIDKYTPIYDRNGNVVDYVLPPSPPSPS